LDLTGPTSKGGEEKKGKEGRGGERVKEEHSGNSKYATIPMISRLPQAGVLLVASKKIQIGLKLTVK